MDHDYIKQETEDALHFQYQVKVEPLDINDTFKVEPLDITETSPTAHLTDHEDLVTPHTNGDFASLHNNGGRATPDSNGGSAAALGSDNLNTCAHCGRSVLRRRFHILNTDSERETGVYNIICQWISPVKVELPTTVICHPCWIKADKESREDLAKKSKTTKQSPKTQTLISDKITLPNYCRAVDTAFRCFVKGCERTDRIRVPDAMRKKILCEYNYYIPQNNRLCKQHMGDESWVPRSKEAGNCLNEFTAGHIQDMFSLNKC